MDEMNGMQGQQPPQGNQGGGAAELLVNINSNLNELGAMVDSSALPDSDKQKFMQLMATFTDFADSLGQPAQGKRPVGGNVPVETMGRPSRPAL